MIVSDSPSFDSRFMPSDRHLRAALWFSVALNALGVAVFLPMATGGQSPLLPVTASPFLAANTALTIALFGGVYAWLALQPQLNRALVVVGGLGKLGFFALAVTYAAVGVVPVRMAVNATPDLILAVIFLWWARTR